MPRPAFLDQDVACSSRFKLSTRANDLAAA
jgi:hypothetical protein